jgi:hypothetical protein
MSVDTLAYEDDGNSLTMKLDEMGFPQILEREAKYKSLIVNNTINIPLAYKLQLGLYMYLRNTDNGIFAITLLEVEDYKHPEYYSTDERKIYYV